MNSTMTRNIIRMNRKIFPQIQPLLNANMGLWSMNLKSGNKIQPGKSFFHQRSYSNSHNQNGSEKGSKFPKLEWFYIPAGVGFGVIAFIQLKHMMRRDKRKSTEIIYEEESSNFVFKQWQVDLLRKLPTRALSRAWGFLADSNMPVWLRKPLINSYSYAFDCNLDEALQSDVTKYETFNQFFSRKLKPGLRESDAKATVVSPADCTVLTFGSIQPPGLCIEQVKGLTYPLSSFVGSRHPFYRSVQSAFAGPKDVFSPGACATDNEEYKLFYCSLYLAPGDYHWFHSPTEWTVEYRRHIPGDLFSVNPRALKSINGIFNFNERVILSGHWEHGPFMYAAVGAYNVGSIKLDIPMDRDLKTNSPGALQPFKDRLYSTGIFMKRGDTVGNFLLGSSVVLVFSAPKDFQFSVVPGQQMKYGNALGYIVKEENKESL